ncbi:MAG: HNH endonuclease signature motif containing protein [Sporichthyaceae bacterium]
MTAIAESNATETITQRNRRVRGELQGLGERIAEGAGHLAAATGAWLVLVAEFDRRGGWAHSGILSCAHWLSWRWDSDGMLLVKGRLTAEDGALLLAALEAARAEVATEPSGDSPAPEAECCEVVRTPANLNADCLVALSRSALAHLATTDPSSAPDHTVNIHVDLADLVADEPTAEGAADGSGARIENGPWIHPETLRRILCDSAAVVVAHHRAGRPGTSMDIGRRSRSVPRRLRRALVLRDRHCRAPGCTNSRYLHAHHVVHWLFGGPTELWNLILLCPAHHHLIHDGGFRVEGDGAGGFTFHTPEAEPIPAVPRPHAGNAAAVRTLHAATIHPRTATPNWSGEKLDLHYAVNVLLLAEEFAARKLLDVPAGMSAVPEGSSLN